MSIKIIKRSQGKSAVAAAAYRGGEKLVNEYDGMTHDYTRKGGVVHSEIMLPVHAPTEFSDRSTLWNSVEKIEKHRRAQLAREIEIALPNELDRAAQTKLVRDYCQQEFVNAGMCVDFSIHDPKGKQENVHAHIMLTMRPLDENGVWDDKQKKEYVLDANGEKIYDPKKKQYKCSTVPTTDWNEQTKAEEWRAAWTGHANHALEENAIPQRLDHRSYERQGIDQIPTIHLGVAASQMEQRGIMTEKGNLNRLIRQDNRLIRELKAKIRKLTRWLKEMASRPDAPEHHPSALVDLLLEHKAGRDKKTSGYSHYGRQQANISDLKKLASAISYLQSNQIVTWEQFQQHIVDIHAASCAFTDKLKQSERRMKALRELLDTSVIYQKTKPVHDDYRQQKSKAKQQGFHDTHTPDLIRHEAAKRKLDTLLPDKKLHIKDWQREYERLSVKRDAEYGRLKEVREQLVQVEGIRKQMEQVRHQPKQQRKQELEL